LPENLDRLKNQAIARFVTPPPRPCRMKMGGRLMRSIRSVPVVRPRVVIALSDRQALAYEVRSAHALRTLCARSAHALRTRVVIVAAHLIMDGSPRILQHHPDGIHRVLSLFPMAVGERHPAGVIGVKPMQHPFHSHPCIIHMIEGRTSIMDRTPFRGESSDVVMDLAR
jgi:hypothetical protein